MSDEQMFFVAHYGIPETQFTAMAEKA